MPATTSATAASSSTADAGRGVLAVWDHSAKVAHLLVMVGSRKVLNTGLVVARQFA